MKRVIYFLLIMLSIISSRATAQPDTTCRGKSNFNFYFTNTNVVVFNSAPSPSGVAVNHYWSFGDGGTQTGINLNNVTHAYNSQGPFTVTHFISTVSGNGLCTDTTVKYVVFDTLFCPTPSFYWYRDSSAYNKIHFVNTTATTSTGLIYTWTFGDGTSSSDMNPVHVFANQGTFTVCLKVQRPNSNCTNQICQTIVIVQPTPCNIYPNFTWVRDSINVNKIKFTNTSAPAASGNYQFLWTFGDGSSSTAIHPDHIYQSSGTYNVCLRMKQDSLCIREICKTIVITSTPALCNIQPYFTWRRDSILPNKVYFTNQSQPAANNNYQFLWTFGDGTSSTDINAVHTYNSTNDSFNVCLKMKRDSSCIREFCKVILIAPPPPVCNIQPNYYWRADSIQTKKIYFTNTTATSATVNYQYLWTFGDGTSSTQYSPVHEYQSSGVYTVCLRVKKDSLCIREICKTVVVYAPAPPCNIVPNFIWRKDSLSNNKIYFTNTTPVGSNIAYQYKWTFGDGTNSTLQNPSHVYNAPGTYNVCLLVKRDSLCIREICKPVVVQYTPGNCTEISKFRFEQVTGAINTFKFVPLVQNSTYQYHWTFGDSSGVQNTMIATHTFPRAGIYRVCLSAYKDNFCASTSCVEVIVGLISCNQTVLSYSYVRNASAPNQIKFTANSNQSILTQQWTITRITGNTAPVIINAFNPTYTFSDSGSYRVCLKAFTTNGCVKEYCNMVTIQPSTTACLLQVYPSPATNQINFSIHMPAAGMMMVNIYNFMGIKVAQHNIAGVQGYNQVTIPVATLPTGFYSVQVMRNQGTNNVSVCTGRFQKL